MDKVGKKDDDEHYSPYVGVQKAALLQEARCFNDQQIKAKKCCTIITKLLYLLSQGEKLTAAEATQVFFSVTKLFQSKDVQLRRMVYLVIKALNPSETEVIIVTSCLTRDMHSNNDLYRANAIRVLCNITDSSMLGQIERFLKQAIVDKQAFVASAALVSGLHLMPTNPEVVRRWVNEVHQAVNTRGTHMVQYHALNLEYEIKNGDRLAISKLVTSLASSSAQVGSPLAMCLLIRYVSRVIEESTNADQERTFFDFLESCLRHKSEMVIFEAARAICKLNNVHPQKLTPAVTVLQLFLSSPKPTLRFAAVRALNRVAMSHPLSVSFCNLDLESLITDSNRSIATLAITTLLKTGSEFSIDRLMKQIASFMNDIGDEFKVVVVDAIRSLCLKYPQKHRTLMNFLSSILREEGGFDYKKSVVETIVNLIHDIPDARDSGLAHLCEFIEDCEFSFLSTQILHLLGQEGPQTANPSKYIRFIYNRVILENATVRAAAVCTLAKFAAAVPSLKTSVMALLRRCMQDSDDEVRDRATFFVSALEEDEGLTNKYIISKQKFPVASLEASLMEYRERGDTSHAFDVARALSEAAMETVRETAKAEAKAEKEAKSGGGGGGGGAAAKSKADSSDASRMYADVLNAVPELAGMGKLFKSSKPVELTESEAEYVVSCIKHTFNEHIVFQFNVTNTLKDTVLDAAVVRMDLGGVEGVEDGVVVPAAPLHLDLPGVTFVALKRTDPDEFPTGSFPCTLAFVSKEVDPSTGEVDEEGYEDEYQLEEVELSTADYVQKIVVADFDRSFESIGDQFEIVEAYSLTSMKTLQDAVNAIIEFLGMQTIGVTHSVAPSAKSHRTLLSGLFLGNKQVCVRADMVLDANAGVNMQLVVRSESAAVSQAIAASVA